MTSTRLSSRLRQGADRHHIAVTHPDSPHYCTGIIMPTTRRTFLLTWKEENKDHEDKPVWPDYRRAARLTRSGTAWETVPCNDTPEGGWDIGGRKDLPLGSRVFVMKQGKSPTGIVAAGFTRTEPTNRPHFKNHQVLGMAVGIRLDVILDCFATPPERLLVVRALLPEGPWNSERSGAEILSQIATPLEIHWAEHLKSLGRQIPPPS